MTASSSLYQPLRPRLVLRLILGKLFQFSKGRQGIFSLGQSPSKDSSSGQLTIIDSRTSRRYQIPIANNAIEAVDIGRIFIGDEFDYSERGNNAVKVLDPGFSNTAAMTSNITFVDGIKGKIYYRDHSIDDLFGHVSFEEVAHLLIWNHLPSPAEHASFRASLNARLSPPASVVEAINILPRDAPPVSIVIAGLAAYAAANPSKVPTAANDPLMYRSNMQAIDIGVLDSLATMAVVVSLLYCHQRENSFMPANPHKSFIENVLIMMGFVDKTTGLPSPRTVQTLDSLWILYLDHEMTNSTAALLHVASTLADPISCCIAMVASANGPLHGGAIDLAYKKFEQLESPRNVSALIKDVKAKKVRLFGYGHRIYKTVDPRAKYLRAMLEEFSEESKNDPLLAIAMEIDRQASTDEYFTSRDLKANADLYGCFVYTALGFEQDIIAPLMLLSRMPGAMAHWREAAGKLTSNTAPAESLIAPSRRSAIKDLATSTGLYQGFKLNNPQYRGNHGGTKGAKGEMKKPWVYTMT